MSVDPHLEDWVSRKIKVAHEDYKRCANWPVIYIRKLTDHPEDRSLRIAPAMHTMEIIYQMYSGDAINELREVVAKGLLESHCKEEGVTYSETPKTWDGFPDGIATINGNSFNLEVTSIHPQTTSKKPIPEYMRLMGAEHISKPVLAPVRHCITAPCPSQQHIAPEHWFVGGKHPPDHTYFEVWPARLAAEFFPIIEAGKYPQEEPYIVTSQIDHTSSMFASRLQTAMDHKAKIIEKEGKDRKNCLIVLSEAMIPAPDWLHGVSTRNCEAIDSIILIALDGYLGMIHNHNWAKSTLTVVLKCGFCEKDQCNHDPLYGTCNEFMEGQVLPQRVASSLVKEEQIYEMNRSKLPNL